MSNVLKKLSVLCLSICLFSTFLSVNIETIQVSAASNEIVSAKYGIDESFEDVTSILKNKVSDGKIAEFTVSKDSIGKDPKPGKNKILLVEYNQGGEFKRAQIVDGKKFALPFNDPYDVEQPAEVKKILAEKLTISNDTKYWPGTGLRGTNSQPVEAFAGSTHPGEYFTDDDFKRMKSLGMNCVRVMIRTDEGNYWRVPNGTAPPPIPQGDKMAPYRNHLKGLEVALKLAEKYDMWIIPSGDNVVGRTIDWFLNEEDGSGYGQTLIELWQYIAKTYGKHPRLIGYDILNEPHTPSEMGGYMLTYLPNLIKEIRKIDKNTFIIVEPYPFASPSAFKTLKPPTDDPKLVYSCHFYEPHEYTHQGITENRSQKMSYPGYMPYGDGNGGRVVNKNNIKNGSLKYVREFQLKYNAIIWVGEFSVVRWAPGADQYLTDVIDIFEEWGWDWVTHAYRGWNGWNQTFPAGQWGGAASNVDDGGDYTNSRIMALKKGWANNKTTNRPLRPTPIISNNTTSKVTQNTSNATDSIKTGSSTTVSDSQTTDSSGGVSSTTSNTSSSTNISADNPLSPLDETKPPKGDSGTIFLIIIISTALMLLVGGFAFWWFKVRLSGGFKAFFGKNSGEF